MAGLVVLFAVLVICIVVFLIILERLWIMDQREDEHGDKPR